MTATRTRVLRAPSSARSIRHLTLIGVGFLLFVAMFLAAAAGPAHAVELWSDISNAQWVSDYHVTALEADTVADGFPDGTFRPYNDVTRGQFAKMAVSGLGVDTANPLSPTYSDVPRTHTFYTYIEGGHAADMIGGYPDGTYRPADKILRQQANSILGKYLAGAEIASRGGIQGDVATYPNLTAWFTAEGEFYLAGYSDEGQISAVHRPATAYLVYREVTLGSGGRLTPTAFLSRAQAVALVLRTADVAADVTTPPPPPTGLSTTPVGPSNVTRPYVTGHTVAEGRVAIYDTFGGSTTEIAQGTADSAGNFSVLAPTLAEGLHSFTAKVRNGSAPISDASAPVEYRLDLTSPAATITAPGDGAGVKSRKPTFTVQATDPGSGVLVVVFEYRPAGSVDDYQVISTDTTTTDGSYEAAWGDRSLADGAYEFRARVSDIADNETVLGSIDVIVDLQLPTVELQAPAPLTPGGVYFTESGTPLFAAAAADVGPAPAVMASGITRVDFLYKLRSALPAIPANWAAADFTLLSSDDGAGYAANWGATTLANGDYIFAVQSVDRAGNASALDTQEVVVDTAAPVVNITAPVAGAKLRGGAPFNITWTATDTYFGANPIKIEYSPDNGTTWPTVITAATANDGTESWSVPAADVATAKIRITATDAMLRATVVVSGAFSIDNTAPAAPTSPTASDNDNVVAGINGLDFTVNWTPSITGDVAKQLIYILPTGTALQLYATHTPVATIPNNTAVTWTGTAAVTADSAGAAFSPTQSYDVYVVAEDQAGNRTPSAAAPWAASSPAKPIITAGADSDLVIAGVNGLDFSLTWTVSADLDVISQRIYILAAGTTLNLATQTPVKTFSDRTTATWTGDAAITLDSTGAAFAAGKYDLYVVAVDDDGRTTASGNWTYGVAAP